MAQSLPPPPRRAVVIGAGSFGTAVAILLTRAGVRTVLQARHPDHVRRLNAERQNAAYLPGVELPRELRVTAVGERVARVDHAFLAVPSSAFPAVIEELAPLLEPDTALVSMAKGLVPPDGLAPTTVIAARLGAARIACLGGPAHAEEMVQEGAALVAASADEALAQTLAATFIRAGVVCEQSNDPIGVELAGAAKNAAALAAGATEAQGLNAAGAAAGHIFAEVWRFAESRGARPESMIGLAGTGDLVATALAGRSRNRRAGELLAQGVPAAEIPARIGQTVEALESVPLLGQTLEASGFSAPVTAGLGRLISGQLPLEEWVSLVRTTLPPPPRWRRRLGRGRARPPARNGWWARWRVWLRARLWLGRHRPERE